MATIPAFRTVLSKGGFAQGLEGFTARSRIDAELQASGIAELDELLGGGFPRGSLVELCGPASSGRTSLCLALLAQATGEQQACAFVDVSDSLDPTSLAAAGVDIARLLWVRCGGSGESEPSELPPSAPPHSRRAKEEARRVDSPPAAHAHETQGTGFLWQHPRDQMRGIETSIPSVVRGGKPVTEARKGSARSLEATRADLIAKCTGEQAEADRRRPRRVDDIARRPPQSERQNLSQPTVSRTPQSGTKKPWKRSEQALKATDDLLHSGGWGLVVLDLGSISWVDARRIPLSTWFRFQRIVENTPTILLLVGEEPCAKGCASVALRCRRGPEKWRRAGSSKIPAGIATLQGFEVEGEVVRSRTRRGPGDSARWEARTVWSGSS